MKKQLPLYFLIIAAILIIYGTFLTFYFKFAEFIPYLRQINLISIGITMFWILFNVVMIFNMLNKGINKYDLDAAIIPFYYFALNTLNALNIHYNWITNYDIHFYISLTTKTIETIVIGRMLIIKKN